jgi:glucose dehydrogenase
LYRTRILGAALLLPLAFTACQKKADPAAELLANPAAVTDERLLAGTSDGKTWPTYNGNYGEHRFSPLKAINTDTVKDLGLAWFADYDSNLDQQGSPLYVDGVIYVSTGSFNKLNAFNAKTGELLWQYNAHTDGAWLRNVCCGNVNRGIAAYNGKIYMGTLDARLVAVDAKTGKPVWETDVIQGDRNDPLNRFSITMAPRVAKGKVFIGASGAEFGVRGWMGAFERRSGASTTCPAIRRRASRTRRWRRPRRPGAASGGSSEAAAPCGMAPSTIR